MSFRNIADKLTTRDEPMASRRNLTISNYAAGTAANLIGGSFLTGLLLLLKADNSILGIVAMTGIIGNLFQIFAPLFLERFIHRKRMLIISRIIAYVFNIFIIGIIPFLPAENGTKLVFILIVISGVSLLNSLMGPGVSIWHIKSIPEDIRRGYYSFYQMTSAIIVYVCIMGASLLLDSMKRAGYELGGLTLIRGIALLLGFIDLLFVIRVKEYPNPVSHIKLNLKSIFILPLKEKKYMPSVIAAVVWSFTANFTGMYFSAYMLKQVQVEYSFLNFVNLLGIPVLILTTPFWNKFIAKHSWFKSLIFTMIVFLFHHLSIAFVTKQTLWIYPISLVIYFAVVPGLNIIFSSIPYLNIPETNQTNYIAFYTTVSTVAALIGISAGRLFMLNTEGVSLNILGMQMVNNQYLLILNAGVTLLMTGIILIMHINMKRQKISD